MTAPDTATAECNCCETVRPVDELQRVSFDDAAAELVCADVDECVRAFRAKWSGT